MRQKETSDLSFFFPAPALAVVVKTLRVDEAGDPDRSGVPVATPSKGTSLCCCCCMSMTELNLWAVGCGHDDLGPATTTCPWGSSYLEKISAQCTADCARRGPDPRFTRLISSLIKSNPMMLQRYYYTADFCRQRRPYQTQQFLARFRQLLVKV